MIFPVSSLNSRTCKELVIQILGSNSALSAKKIHKQAQEKFQTTTTYQAIHKALKLLVEEAVAKKFENEYYLNQEWINKVHAFVQDLKDRKSISEILPPPTPLPDFKERIELQPIYFIPFWLGKFRKVPLEITVLDRTKEKIIFEWREEKYVWYDTGVAVLSAIAPERKCDAIDFLWERRRVHQGILNKEYIYATHIEELLKLFNLKSDPQLSYVMSIHRVKKPQNPDLLKLFLHPTILGIPDNPKVNINPENIKMARHKLNILTYIESPDTYEISFSATQKIFASWSNVVFYSDKESLLNELITLECELQHLWFYFYTLKNKVRNALRKNNRKEIKHLFLRGKKCTNWWHNFEQMGAVDDFQTLSIKEGLIKTSKIEKIYNDLQKIFTYCEEGMIL